MVLNRGQAAVASIIVAASWVALSPGAAPATLAQPKAVASVVNHDATLRGDGTVPVKLHCAAASTARCSGTLRLVVKFNGSQVKNTKQAFVVPGKKTRTFHLQATGGQLELFLQSGQRDALVKVKEKKPHDLPVHSAVITVHVPS